MLTHATTTVLLHLYLQLSGKESAHLCHVLVVIHVAVPLVPTQFPLGGADWWRACPVARDGR